MRESTSEQKYELKACQANSSKYFWHKGPKIEISWNKFVIFDKCKESQYSGRKVNRVENDNVERWNNRQRSDIVGYCRP